MMINDFCKWVFYYNKVICKKSVLKDDERKIRGSTMK